jgi:hypothetical protein
MAWQRRGWIATYRSKDTSLADFTRCLNLNPSDPDKSNTLLGVSTAHFLAGRYDEAAEWAVRGVREQRARCGHTGLWPVRRDAVDEASKPETARPYCSATIPT